jgi:surface protein
MQEEYVYEGETSAFEGATVQTAGYSSEPKTFADKLIFDTAVYFDWSLLSPRQFVFRYRGIDAGFHASYAGWNLNPGAGFFLRFNTGLDTFQIPVILSLSMNDYIRMYAGPVFTCNDVILIDSDKEIKGSIFPGIIGLSLSTPKWNIGKVENMEKIFYGCSSLTELPDLSKWNTSNVIILSYVFEKCSSLKKLPDISKWKTNKVTNMNGLFYGCKSLSYLPDISKWNTSNVDNFGFMFYGCSSLVYLPNISKWDISSAGRIDSMFQNCISLLKFPNLSRWKTYKSLQTIYIFDKCISALSFPTIKQSFFNQFNWT